MAAKPNSTRVVIVGGGPAGLLLSYLLHRDGIDNIVLERRDREYTVQRVRAGVLEHDSVQLLREVGLGERLDREGLAHGGIYLQYEHERHHIPFTELVGRQVWIYGQQEVVRDLIAAHDAAGTPALYEVDNVELHDIDTSAPSVTFTHNGAEQRISCDYIVGADGFHGVSRPSIPGLTHFERDYPFGWLGILVNAAPSTDEIVYALGERGFAMHSMRSPHISRLYLQVDPHDSLEHWPDERIWDELDVRLATPGWSLGRGEITDKSITPMRSFVSATMRHGSLFLAGDAAHIVPPTGAKGLNLAISDVAMLHEALTDYYRSHSTAGLDEYSPYCLRRVWQIQHFSNWMTRMLHRFHEGTGPDAEQHAEFDYRVQLGQLSHVCSSRAAMTYLAEFYTGLPMERSSAGLARRGS